MEGLDKSIHDLIAKQLPGIHAEALKKYIEQAEKDKEELLKLKDIIAEEAKVKERMNQSLTELSRKVATFNDLNLREEKLKESERSLELEKLKYEVNKKIEEIKTQEAEKRANDAVTIATLLVKNPVLSEKFFESKYYPGGSTINRDGTTTNHYSGNSVEEREYTKEVTKREL